MDLCRPFGFTAMVISAALAACVAEPTGTMLRHGPRNGDGSTTDSASLGSTPKSAGSGASAAASAAAQAKAQADAKALFVAVQPDLSSNCGAACHEQGTGGAPTWLAGPDQYASIKAYKGIVVADPKTSLLLTKGSHEGPPLPAALTAPVTAWLTAESVAIAAAPAPAAIETTAVALGNGNLSIALPAPGGQITFTSSLDGGVLTMKALTLVAPATTPVHALGIHFEIVHVDGTISNDESLATTEATAPAGKTAPLGIGLVVIARIASTDQLKIAFDTLDASGGAGGTTTTQTLGGCKDVTSFQTNAAPAIQQNTCLNCHNTGGSGNGAMDLSGLAATPPDFATACAQAKNKIDTTNVAQSPILQAPTGGIAAHPFKNASAQFTTMMTTWINAEK
jgi:hypothetical protein